MTLFLFYQARGEAEAELAFLNKVGVIDAIMTDDVDALLFGAKMIIRKYVVELELSELFAQEELILLVPTV